ncbi:MAG: DNA-directed RNA polymerase subunit alpha C-terminal domain-containing protein [Planctomycetaceae bacterium]|nr:tetratricopeptide repeat protein [Planctomycetaceae bacterium]
MPETVSESLDTVVQKENWTLEDHDAILVKLTEESNAPARVRKILATLEAENPDPKGPAAQKIGIARYMLWRFESALEALAAAADNKDRRFFQALCYKHLRRYDKALEEFARARDKGADQVSVDIQIAETHALSGNLETAQGLLGKLAKTAGSDPRFLVTRGLTQELAGNDEQALADYQRALEINPNDTAAMFRLAFFWDLHGEEEQAMTLYKQCVERPPVFANALLNLATLYEDQGLYDNSISCLRRILMTNPNHPRARMFLKDAESSKNMYYDEDQARRIAHRNAILDIPVTDFELSVRARNCLKKMNIRTLGDLIRTSEAELMSYKNFGETSLREIKSMLGAKGLRLGQALEEAELSGLISAPATKTNVKNEGVLATPMAQIAFSKRARKALDNLGITTLGELTAKTEAELLACENFGQTSLNEIRQRLGEYGLALREPD